MIVQCSVCGFELGNALELQEQVKLAGYDTPTSYGDDPRDATWICGHHVDEIGEDWPEDLAYWYVSL